MIPKMSLSSMFQDFSHNPKKSFRRKRSRINSEIESNRMRKNGVEESKNNNHVMIDDEDLDDDESDGSSDIDGNEHARHFTSTVIVEQFLHKLFPGRSIFTKKRNILEIISVHHDYLSMAGGSSLNQSRTIRFLLLVSTVLSAIFTDTIFFGIYYPGDSNCSLLVNEVRGDEIRFLLSKFYFCYQLDKILHHRQFFDELYFYFLKSDHV